MANQPKIAEHILKDGSSVFKATVYIGVNPNDGKKKYKKITRPTYREVEEELKRIAVGRLDNTLSKGDNMTFSQVYEEWLETYKTTVKPTTLESVTAKMKAVLPYLRHLKLKKIGHRTCQNMINSLMDDGRYKRSTVINYKMCAAKVFRYCEKQGYIAKNPMKFVEVPRSKEDFFYSESDRLDENRKYWTKAETIKFLELARAELKFHDFVMFRILLFTGMRKGELHALHWNDINFDTGEVKILKTLATIDGVDILQKPKTKTSLRSVTLDKETLQHLKTWRKEQRENYLALGNKIMWDNNPPIFSHPEGKYFPLSHLNNVMSYNFYLHHPDFYKITVHQMRHTHASLLFESGATVKDVQWKLGHQDIQTTYNIYTHVTETKEKATFDSFANFMEI